MADTPFPPDGRPEMPAPGVLPPFIVDQRPGPGRSVMVTWSLPGLRRLTVRVPWNSWVEGHHLAVGPAASSLLDTILPDSMSDE